MKLKFLGALMASAMVATSGNAATIFFSTSFAPTLTDFTSSTVSLSGFNGALGTLTGVTIDWGYGVAVSGTVTNTSGAPIDTILDTTSRGTFNFGGSYVSNNNHLFANSSYEYEGLAAGVPTAYGPYSPSNVGSISFISGLGTFVGTALTVRLKTLSGYGFTGGGNNAAASLTQLGSGTAKITYTYNEAPPPVPTVPEAATWAMMLAGFGMMGATLRRRRPSVSFG